MRIENLMMLAMVSALSFGLAGCGEQAAPEAKWETLVTAEQAFAANLKKAEAGDAEAQKGVGVAYFDGKGVTKDLAKAVQWMTKAAEQGHVVAQRNLGILHEHGEGVPRDLVKAKEWYEKAVTQGDAGALTNLGRMYLRGGEGVAKDVTKAVELIRQAVEKGWAESQAILAWMYANGEGVPKDLVKAKEWYEKAAAQGDSDAQTNLGLMYSGGEGVPKDGVKAAEWWQKAAVQGDSTAQQNVAWAYSTGEGVSKDVVLAYAWANLSASKGEQDAVKRRDQYESQLSAAEKAEAQRLSSNWKTGQLLVRENQPAGSTAKTPVTIGNLTRTGTGTAFIVSNTGQAITNHHVIEGCKEVRAEGREGVVKVTTSDVINDLTLLQLPGAVNATAAITSDPAKLRQGEDIIAFGFPLNALLSSGGNLTPGVVSALTGLGNNTNQIQITAPIQPGSSGSPVLNKKGEVVGVVSMKLSDTKMVKATGSVGQNVNFAVSGQTLKSFLDTHKVDYRKGGFMSFEKSTADLADEARKWTTVVECWR